MNWSAEVPASREILDEIEKDPAAFERMSAQELADAIRAELDAALAEQLRCAHAAIIRDFLSVFEDARRDRHRQLFGHPLARVFIFGDRLVVVHPGGAA